MFIVRSSRTEVEMFAQTYSSDGGAGIAIAIVIGLGVVVLYAVALWRVFTKAGQPGWAAIIPIYNYYVILKIVGRPGWWLLLYLVPVVNVVILVIVANDLSKSFGHGVGFTLGLVFLSIIFYAILGFGDSRYLGPAGAPGGFRAAPVAPGTLPPPPA
jgi:hypothetical protein